MDRLLMIGSTLLGQIPLLIACAVVAVNAVNRWDRHPRASMFTVSGLGLIVFNAVVLRTLYTLIPMHAQESGRSVAEMGVLFTVLGVVGSVVMAAAIGLLGAAVFSERRDGA